MGDAEDRTNEEWFAILDALRDNGSINMFDAPKWIADEFDIPLDEAKGVFLAWWAQFGQDDTDKKPSMEWSDVTSDDVAELQKALAEYKEEYDYVVEIICGDDDASEGYEYRALYLRSILDWGEEFMKEWNKRQA